ncbi:DUF6602 domain-containing protein [Arcicella aquatica]|uniref:DUF6602 domain-containing protein n=1 Tax=Arcicella aquatica TaxID=217141 RepID=A0ABU5QKD9_9BACT|nr:DUF6602 domain-containing protein [Arcicella aquatica]MEA5257214.1 DUF6602 domain-containing protein [Arcicella aquatica]
MSITTFFSDNNPNEDLIEFFTSTSQNIENEYRRIQRRATEDPGTAGDQGEENWKELLSKWLPSTFKIVTKGRILNTKGKASPQIDVIVLRPEYPEGLINTKLYLATGVLAAFECKLTLKATHIKEFFESSVEIKNLTFPKVGSPYKELHSSILYGLLCHSHSWKNPSSKPIENVTSYIETMDKAKIKHPKFAPDLICIADLTTWSICKTTFFGPRFVPNFDEYIPIYGKNGSAVSSYLCFSSLLKNQVPYFNPLAVLITRLLCKLSREYPSLKPISSFFEAANIQGKGEGKNRYWDSSIYSSNILGRVCLGGWDNNDSSEEWKFMYT